MKIQLFSFTIILVLLFAACSNNTSDTSSEEQTTTSSPQPLQASIPHTAPTFYKRYEGTIAGEPVVVYLQKKDSFYTGNYYYKKIGNTISINGMSKDADSLLLEEYDNAAVTFNNSYEPSKWICSYSGEEIKGKWKNESRKKSYDIILKESYPPGSYSFEMKRFYDSAVAFPNEKNSPMATSSYEFPLALGNTDESNWFNAEIKKMLYIENGNWEQGIKKLNDSFFGAYKKEIQEERKLYNEGEYPASWNYDETSTSTIRYNEKEWVVVENSVYSYAGGAHGNYGSSFYNMDMKDKKLVDLGDVLKIDSISLQKILERHFRKDYKLSATAPLTEVLFDPHLATTDNFYISEKGLGFLYNPYEIASYAQGQIEVFVPYPALTTYFTEYFKKRMNL